MELEVVSSKYGGSDGTEAEVGEVSATTKSDPAVPTLAAEHSTTIGEVSTAALCSLDSQDESETLVDADVAALEEVGPDITMALDVLPEPMPSKQQEGSRIRDNVSQIADAAAEAIPTAADPEVQCVLFVRRMMKAFRKCGEDQLRLAWKIGAVLKRLRDQRDHGNKKGQDQTWAEFCHQQFGLSAKTAGRYIKVHEGIPQHMLSAMTLTEAYRRVGVIRGHDEEWEPTKDGDQGVEDAGAGDEEREPAKDGDQGVEDAGAGDEDNGSDSRTDTIEDEVERKSHLLKDRIDKFFRAPDQVKIQVQQIVTSVLADPMRRDNAHPVGVDLAEFVHGIATKMEATKSKIDLAILEIWRHLEVNYPLARKQYLDKCDVNTKANRNESEEFCSRMNEQKEKYGEEWFVRHDGRVARRPLEREEVGA